MYIDSARVYDLLTDGKDYGLMASQLMSMFKRVHPHAATLLDVGCGTGRHLREFGRQYQCEGLDLSPQMLAVAAERCAGTVLHQADLRNFDLGRRFDIVTCLFGSLGYAQDEHELSAAAACLAAHVAPGGLLVVEPWLSPETFVSGKQVFDTVSEGTVKVARMYLTRRDEDLSIYDVQYMVGTPASITCFSEHQTLGLFTPGQYQQALETTGLRPADAGVDGFGYGLHVLCKDAA